MLTAYVAHAITNKTGNEVWKASIITELVLRRYGIKALDPIVIEGIPRNDEPIPNRPDADGSVIWHRDKKAIRDAHVLLDITPESKSEGVLRELGYARFFLWKPVIRVYQPGSEPHMATVFEDDVIAYSLDEAAKIIVARWGTWPKRILWRLKILFTSFPKFLWYQLLEFK